MIEALGVAASAATALAFVLAAVSYFSGTRSKLEAQARLVYTTADQHLYHEAESVPVPAVPESVSVLSPERGRGLTLSEGRVPAGRSALQVIVTVTNRSEELVGPIRIDLVDASRGGRLAHANYILDFVEPGSSEKCSITTWAPMGGGSVYPSILFRDASARWWRRIAHGPVEWVHDDPANVAWNHPYRVPSMKRRDGFWGKWPPSQRLRPQTVLSRGWRLARGKTAIP